MNSVIVYAPPGAGKSRAAQLLRAYFKLPTVREEWAPGKPLLQMNTVHLTNVMPKAGENEGLHVFGLADLAHRLL